MNVILLGFEPDTLDEERVAQVQGIAQDNVTVLVTCDREEIEPVLDDIEIIAGWFPRDLLPRAKNLRWFQEWAAGADWLLMDHPEIAALDFVLTNASGVHPIPASEHVFAFLLAFSRNMHRAIRTQADRKWIPWDQQNDLFELDDQRMLLLGVGAIGQRVAEVAQVLGMHVWGVRRNPTVGAPVVARMFGPDRLLDILPEADCVVLTVPLTQETQGMIGEPELKAMKPAAYLVNVGRGGTVQERALIRALREGWIAGAGLDVFEDEPLPDDSPLWAMDNVIITAHYAGVTPRYHERAWALFLDNLQRYQAGEPLRNVVDKRQGY